MTTTPELVNVVFYVALFGLSIIFSLLTLTFNVAEADDERKYLGTVYSGFSFVFWATTGVTHLSVAASFSQELISLAWLWYGLAIFFFIYMIVMLFKAIKIIAAGKEFTI